MEHGTAPTIYAFGDVDCDVGKLQKEFDPSTLAPSSSTIHWDPVSLADGFSGRPFNLHFRRI